MKVHYWFSDSFRGQYRAYRNNVLMPPGNYAARITHDNGHILLYSFYVEGHDVERSNRAFPPPKQLIQNSEGELKLTSYWRWKEMEGNRSSLSDLPFRTELNNPTSEAVYINEALILKSVSGYEIFSFLNAYSHFSWEGKLQIVHRGKCGLVFNLDDGLNGYFISLDAIRGIAQIRGWGARPDRIFKDYTYHHLQDNEFSTNSDMLYAFKLIRWGSYIELSLNGIVVLSLINSHFNGSRIGFYTESVGLKITESVLYEINEPSSETL